MITVRTLPVCTNCETDSHWCEALRLEVTMAVALVTERAQRHGGRLPDAEVVIDCHSFWPRHKKHG